MTRFPTPAHLASWAKFAPGINASAGKTKGNGSTGHGNHYLARILREAVAGAGRTPFSAPVTDGSPGDGARTKPSSRSVAHCW
jgi:hypothetical protein